MERTGIIHLPKDLMVHLGLELDLPDILNFSMINKKINHMICNNYTFWMNKHLRDFNWNYTGDKTLVDIRDSYKTLSYWWDASVDPENRWELTDSIILETPGLLNLTTLDASYNGKITDTSVAKMTSLTSLNARSNPKITDASVSKLTSLISLNASWNWKITDKSVGKLTSLIYLNASINTKITDVGVSKLISLTTLYNIHNPKITDRGILQLPNLVNY